MAGAEPGSAVAALAATALAAWAPPALASGPDDDAIEAAGIASEATQIAVGSEMGDAPFGEAPLGDSTVVADSGAKDVVASADAAGLIVIGTGDDDTLDIGISLPVTASAKGVEVVDGDAIYIDEEADTSFVVDARDDGARIVSVLESPQADHAVSYDFQLPRGAALVGRPDGGVDVLLETGEAGVAVEAVIASIAAPWAVDARGRSVTTRYTVTGDRLIQHIEPSASTTYPISADPRVDNDLWRIRVYWNLAETRTIAQGGWAAATLAGICTAAGGPLLGAACLAQFGSIVATAQTAVNYSPDRCLLITQYPPSAILYSSTYSSRNSGCR